MLPVLLISPENDQPGTDLCGFHLRWNLPGFIFCGFHLKGGPGGGYCVSRFVHGRLPYEKLERDPVLRNILNSMPQRKVVRKGGGGLDPCLAVDVANHVWDAYGNEWHRHYVKLLINTNKKARKKRNKKREKQATEEQSER